MFLHNNVKNTSRKADGRGGGRRQGVLTVDNFTSITVIKTSA